MSERPVFDALQEILVDALGVDASEVTPDAQLAADLGAESIDILDISFRIEEEYDVSLPTKEWTQLFSDHSGQLDTAELAAHLREDLGIELSDEEREAYADRPLGEVLDEVESRHGVRVDEEQRLRYARLGTQALLDGFAQLLRSDIEGETRERIVQAAARCGFDEAFWQAVASVLTVKRLAHFVEQQRAEQGATAAGASEASIEGAA